MKHILTTIFLLISLFALGQAGLSQVPKGAWKSQEPTGSTSTLIVADNYLAIASYSVGNKYFERSEGGPFTMSGDKMTYTPEFNSADTAKIGIPIVFTVTVKDDILTLRYEEAMVWMRVDDATDVPMAGAWHITARASGGQGELVKIHQEGTRKTLKLLSKTRFQWFAIDPAVKGFYATGGGTYTVQNGKYTENIQFFSKDNNRVGSSLKFDYKLENGRWDHSGKSSDGKPVHEIWEKIK
ncbi:hypothetical protein [Dyadobacter pollutisoli]|jgi:hypothetical protein|uniref:Membrane or secreted protein n=1 Tax=Dyadobacter pollutisoli TaxID=2910158 RepID=A0A9E8NA44_9BACT|nr:hypothetical protein [Dyadobacter pollutisoli]WAC11271.1 hypothetical protein ON006_26515 [Dyadobacter pollutisoli]